MNFTPFTTRAKDVTKNHHSNGYAMSRLSVETAIFRAQSVTKNHQSDGSAMSPTRFIPRSLTRTMQVLALLLLACISSIVTVAQTPTDNEWLIFVSQRAGASELYLMNLSTRQVSQMTNTGRGHLSPATAANARVLAFSAREGNNYELFTAAISSDWRTRRPLLAAVNRLTVDTVDEWTPSLSADGKIMAFASGDGLELMLTNGQGRRVVVPSPSNPVFDLSPAISPDGRQIAFISNRSGAREIWLANTTTSELRQLTSGGAVIGGLGWSGDSQQIVFTTTATDSKLGGIAIANVTSGTFHVLTQSGDNEPTISPSGTRIVFTSQRDGSPELYLLNLNTNAVERLTHNQGMVGSAVFIPGSTSPGNPAPPTRRELLLERIRR